MLNILNIISTSFHPHISEYLFADGLLCASSITGAGFRVVEKIDARYNPGFHGDHNKMCQELYKGLCIH